MSRHDRIRRAALVSSGALGLVLLGGGAALAASPGDLLPTGLLPSPSPSGSLALPLPTVSLPNLPLPSLPLPVPTAPAPTTGSAPPSPSPSNAPSTGGSTTSSAPGAPTSGSAGGPGSSAASRSGGLDAALGPGLDSVRRLPGALASGVGGLVGGAWSGARGYGPGVHPDLLSAQDLAGRYGFAAPASDQAVPAPVVAEPVGAGRPQALSTPSASGALGALASADSGRGDDAPVPGLGVIIATVAVGAAGAAHVGYLQLRPRR